MNVATLNVDRIGRVAGRLHGLAASAMACPSLEELQGIVDPSDPCQNATLGIPSSAGVQVTLPPTTLPVDLQTALNTSVYQQASAPDMKGPYLLLAAVALAFIIGGRR